MKCPKCNTDNRENAKFCLKCGQKLELTCPHCSKLLPQQAQFCDDCGKKIDTADSPEALLKEIEGERKYVSVLFSDLSGYTAMSETLDPEDIKEITNRIFSQVSNIIEKYDGFVEKFVGDAVMALFGVPKSHEDDPVRAIRVAREIHEYIDSISPELEKRIGRPISMHSGINSGLVVTGKVDGQKGSHGAAGDTINTASRLCSQAKIGEILVGFDTYRQAEGHFLFEKLAPTVMKGKSVPVDTYRVLAQKESPVTTHRLSGLKAELVGRKVELSTFHEALDNLQKGKGHIFSISGDAGTGKSRLIAEFKDSLNLTEIQWVEGHAYPYAQNIPYYPLIDLLNRTFRIKEDERPEIIRNKIESGIENLLGKREDIVPYVGSLYSFNYPEVESVSPEFWKHQLQETILVILTALARHKPTIFFLEDLHWADPSTVELLRYALSRIRQPSIVLCVFRPTFSLFTGQQQVSIGKIHDEIQLQDLSSSETQDMLMSLLKTKTIPSDLSRYVQHKAEGNPFYLEELVNSLIESNILVSEDGCWKVSSPIRDSDVSSTIHGIIASRLDRLEEKTKRILQEASVIGRAFLYDILKRITLLKQDIDRSLNGLERLDLIRARSLQPELEYAFKHALIQDVAYNGILRKERQEIHERIAKVTEQIFQDRLPEFYETLAYHYKQSISIKKAVYYLIQSGEKSLRRYAVQESHLHFKEAFDLLSSKVERTNDENELLIELLMKWAQVFYYRGDFKGLTPLLEAHEAIAQSLENEESFGMFLAWQGWALFNRHRYKESYNILQRALKIGENIEKQHLIGYACCWLSWTCSNLGQFDEAIRYGESALGIANSLPADHYLYFKSLGGIGWASHFRGDKKRSLKTGEALLDYGKKYSETRSLVLGHFIIGFAHFHDDEFELAVEACRNATQLSADPYYFQFSNLLLGVCYFLIGEVKKAEHRIREVQCFAQEYGCENIKIPANANFGLLMMASGEMSEGLQQIEKAIQVMNDNGNRSFQILYEFSLGLAFLQIVNKTVSLDFSAMIKNMGFVVKNVPSAAKKTENHFKKTIKIAEEIGANGIFGKAYFNLGLLYKIKGKNIQAKECILKAIQAFEKGALDNCLKAAKTMINSMD